MLGKFSNEDQAEIERAVNRAADAAEVWIEDGIQSAMNQFNADPNKPIRKKDKPGDSVDDEKSLGTGETTQPVNTGLEKTQSDSTNNKSQDPEDQ